jgi:Stigma-specific protein, Stig1
MERLDELSKLLAGSVSRRESLRSMGAVLAGAVLGSLGAGMAWAARPDRCVAFCRSCPTKKKRNQCQDACRACNGNTGRLCGSCGAVVCCATGTTCCNGTCTSLSSDPHNCGACGHVCAAAAPYCNQGVCISNPCPGGGMLCGGACIDTNWDALNCGGCNIRCNPQDFCSFGVCEGYCFNCG